ncbi:teichoic acid D-Ala incorporation-associated protein DltX [Streptococcus ruminantium]|nr:teichoic acid D-Ala incorporation-associated protein DltX [Streptococcus ruminantium]
MLVGCCSIFFILLVLLYLYSYLDIGQGSFIYNEF